MTKRAKVVITGTAYMARPDAEHQPDKWYVPENVHATVQFNDNGPIGWAALNKWDDGRIHAVVTFPAIDPERLKLCPYLGISVSIHPDGSGEVRGVAIVDENVDKEVPRYTATVEYLDDKPNTPMPARPAGTYESLLNRIQTAVQWPTLRPIGADIFQAYKDDLITDAQASTLDRAWKARADELNVTPPPGWKNWSYPRSDRVIPAPDVISLADLRRLDLKPGDTLAIVAPTDNMTAVRYLQEKVREILDEFHPGCLVMVFPQGTELSVIPAETEDPVGDAPTGDNPESDDLGMPAAWVSGLR